MDQKAWAQFLLREGVLRFGDFVLKDGSHSPFFLDFGVLSSGSAFRELGRFFGQRIEETVGFQRVEFLYGPPYKATSLSIATAMVYEAKELHCHFRRKEAKAHGEKGLSFGYQPQAGERFLLLDDVMSSGATKVEAVQALPDNSCLAVVVGVDRQHQVGGETAAENFSRQTSVPLISLITLRELCQAVEGEVSPEHLRSLREYARA